MKIETLKAIKNLAENGATAGERQAALGRLNELCRKYQLNVEDLTEEELFPIELVTDQYWQGILALKLAQMVSDNWNVRFETKKIPTKMEPHRAKLTIFLTHSEIAEIKNIYPLYLKEVTEQINEFVRAFCIQSEIYPPTAGYDGPLREMPDDFSLMILAARKMARPFKQLEAENG